MSPRSMALRSATSTNPTAPSTRADVKPARSVLRAYFGERMAESTNERRNWSAYGTSLAWPVMCT